MNYGSLNMLIKHQLMVKKRIYKAVSGIAESARTGGAEDGGRTQMAETRLYVGLNDAQTRQQKYETEKYVEQLKKICFTYHIPFSIGFEEGGYFHENGEYVEEKTLVLTLIDAEKDTVRNIAKDLCALFNQESVLITEDTVSGSYVTG